MLNLVTVNKNHITQVFEQISIYGEKKVHQQLLEDGFNWYIESLDRY
jgi:putative transposase